MNTSGIPNEGQHLFEPSGQNSAAPGDSESWYYIVGDKTCGPATTARIRSFIAAGAIPSSSLVFRDGMQNWVSADALPEFQTQVERVPAAITSHAGGTESLKPGSVIQKKYVVLAVLVLAAGIMIPAIRHHLIQDPAVVKRTTEELARAVQSGDDAGAERALTEGADVNAALQDERSALMLATSKNRIASAKLLLRKKAQVNTRTSNGTTALMLAAENGSMEMVKLLLDNGAEVNAKRDDVENATTPLLMAVSGPAEVIKLLVERGADVNMNYADGRPFLCQLLRSRSREEEKQSVELVKFALDRGARVNATEKNGTTALMLVSLWDEEKAVELARALIAKGADVNARQTDGTTPLILAVMNGRTEVVRVLLANGANVGMKTTMGSTAMDFAQFVKRSDLVQLLEHGVAK